MALGLFHFQLLQQILERIHYSESEIEVATAVLQGISGALDSEGGTIFKLQKSGALEPIASFGVPAERLRSVSFHAGRGVVGWVVQHAQPVKVDMPSTDTRFVSAADVITGFKTRNIIAAPVLTKGQIVGVIEFLNKKEGPFTAPDLELVSMIGREVGIAFENVRLLKELRAAHALLDAMTDSFTAGVLVVDQELTVLRVNPRALKILGSAENKAAWMGRPAQEKLAGLPGFFQAVQSAVSSEKALPRMEVKQDIGGHPRTIGYSAAPVKDAAGERLGSALLFQDITDYKK